ncbi:MAG: CdaR family protein [Spirochaetales bacterium]
MKKFDASRLLDQWPAKVLALGAALLLFLFNRFDSLQVKTLSIPLRLMADTTLVPSQEWNKRVKVTLRGSEDVLSALDETSVEVLADFSSHQGEGLWKTSLQVVRHGAAAEADSLEILVDPLEISLAFEKKLVKTLPVQPNFVGQPGKNYELSGFQVIPSLVTLEGPRSVVEKLTAVTTEPIELRGKTDTFKLRAIVNQENTLLSYPYGSTVEVQGLMTSSLASLVLDAVVPTPINLNSSLRLQSPLPPVKVKLRGTPEALAALGTGDNGSPSVVLLADLGASAIPGEIPALPIKAQLPDNVELVSLEPSTVAVYLEVKP